MGGGEPCIEFEYRIARYDHVRSLKGYDDVKSIRLKVIKVIFSLMSGPLPPPHSLLNGLANKRRTSFCGSLKGGRQKNRKKI